MRESTLEVCPAKLREFAVILVMTRLMLLLIVQSLIDLILNFKNIPNSLEKNRQE